MSQPSRMTVYARWQACDAMSGMALSARVMWMEPESLGCEPAVP